MAQLNFTSKAVFLENSFMSDFLDEAELCLEKIFSKIASQTTSCIVEREIRESCNKLLFFQLHPNLCLCERRGKNNFTHEAVLKISV